MRDVEETIHGKECDQQIILKKQLYALKIIEGKNLLKHKCVQPNLESTAQYRYLIEEKDKKLLLLTSLFDS